MGQETAIQWLIRQILDKKIEFIYTDMGCFWVESDDILNQAKAMEKWQIKDAYFEGRCDWRKPYAENMEKAEKYYNVTYKNNEQ